MENQKICQSCGMPLNNQEELGTEKNGAKNEDYCVYCFKDGAFTSEITMEEMIAFCSEHSGEWGIEITKEEATAQMQSYFPMLKRWAKA